MVVYKDTVDGVIDQLEKFDRDREEVIALTRKLNRASGRAVASLVRNRDYKEYLESSRKLVKQISDIMETLAPVTSWSTTSSGTEEYAELEILHAILKERQLPTPEELHVPPWIWIAGLGDVIGELRRLMLSQLIEGNTDEAKIYLTKIQDLYDTIVGLEFSKALVSNLRRKIDVARTLVDRCESDYANAVIHKQTKSSTE